MIAATARCSIVRHQPHYLFEWAARDFLSLASGRRLTVVLPGETVLIPFLRALLSLALRQPGSLNEIQWFQTHEFMGREARSFEVLHEHFFGHALQAGLLTQQQIHRLSVRDGAETYARELQECGGLSVAFLVNEIGANANGDFDPSHCGGLFPNSESVWAAQDDFVLINDAPALARIAASPHLLSQARFGYGFVLGERQRPTLQLYTEQVAIRLCPMKLMTSIPRSFLLTDLSE